MLISASDCADLLGILPTDKLLVRLVASTDAWIKRSLGRTFERDVRTEFVRGYGVDYVYVRESPIIEITEVRIDPCGKFSDSTIVTDLTRFTFDPDPLNDDNRVFYAGGREGFQLGHGYYAGANWFPEGERVAQITYEAGFDDDIPVDLSEQLIERVAAKYKQGPDEEMKTERQGDRSWEKFEKTDERILAALRRYRR